MEIGALYPLVSKGAIMKKTKRRVECNSVLDVVLANTGKTASNFFEYQTKKYEIDKLDEAVSLIRCALFDDDVITVVGDYDADGITSSAILKLLFDTLGANINIRLPRRFSEGYGLSEKIIDEIDSGLLITVDNGIVAIDAIKKAKEKGLKVIVIDHHLGLEDGTLPEADVVIDPNAIENSATFNSYCGAGLSYKLAEAFLGSTHPMMKKITSLAAIGTIADVMPLIEENRLIVENGLKYMTTDSGRTAGLGALLTEYNIEKHLIAKDIGFKIGPAINAPGRLFDDGAMRSFELLSFDGYWKHATIYAKQLVEYNNNRKKLAAEGTAKVEENIKRNNLLGNVPMAIYEPGLPEGLVGIFAGRIAEKYKTPCLILTDSEDPEILKGSARSYGDVHLKNILDAHSELLTKYGGHAEAAGLSLEKKNFEEFARVIQEGVEMNLPDSDEVLYDLEITANDLPSVMMELDKYAPYGEGNPEIVFSIKNVDLFPGPRGFYDTMGDEKQHLKLYSKTAEIVAFDASQKYLEAKEPRRISLVGSISKNTWHAKITPQIECIDFDAVEIPVQSTPLAALLAKMGSER